MSRQNRVYDKPPLTIDEMVDLLESRNLSIPDRDQACHYLHYINYYRLSGYAYLLEENHIDGARSHRFRQDASFNDLLSLYVFDRQLRLLVMDAIERVEVAVRSVMAYELSHKYGDGHWILNAELFKTSDEFNHKDLIKMIKRETSFTAEEGTDRHKRREPFINHYYANYDDPALPPSWMLVEIMTLGTWSKVYANLKVSKDRKQISRVFDLAPDMLESWLHSLTCLRNLCAHHSPIYGRRMMAYPPQTRTGWPELPRTAFARRVAVLEYLLRKVAPGTQWRAKVKALIDGEPLVNPELLGIQHHDFWECEL